MKQLLLFILLFIGLHAAYAQTDSIYVRNKWCAKADSPLLFATANNVIYVYSKTIKPADLVVKSLDNALKIGLPEIKGDTISFMAMPYPKLGKKMRLAISSKQTKKVLRTVNFSSEDAPQPVARVGIVSTVDVSKKLLLEQTMLRASFPNSLYSYPYRVKEYTFKTRIAGRDILLPVKGCYLSKEVTRVLELAPVGTLIEFVDIKATCPECSARDLPPIKHWVR